jgi:arginase family enzyme
MILESGFVSVQDSVLLGARSLDPPETKLIQEIGLATSEDGLAKALDATDAVYVALDADVLDAREISCFMPEPGGPTLAEVELLLRGIARRSTLVGLGLTGLTPDPANAVRLGRLCSAAGL